MRAFVSLVVISVALLFSTSAYAKEGVVATLLDPLPQDPPVGSVISVAWMLVIPGEHDQPFNACGVFVQLRSPSGGALTRAYADADCRAHVTGEYESRVVVPNGGIGAIEIGLSGPTDVFLPGRGSRPGADKPANGRLVRVAIGQVAVAPRWRGSCLLSPCR